MNNQLRENLLKNSSQMRNDISGMVAVLARRHAVLLPEIFDKSARVVKAAVIGDLGDGVIRAAQLLFVLAGGIAEADVLPVPPGQLQKIFRDLHGDHLGIFRAVHLIQLERARGQQRARRHGILRGLIADAAVSVQTEKQRQAAAELRPAELVVKCLKDKLFLFGAHRPPLAFLSNVVVLL